jgi:hypothetical protein
MSDAPDHPPDDEGELGELLRLLHDAADPFRTVEATYRTWRHQGRQREASLAYAEEQERRGASIMTSRPVGMGSGDPGPSETEETLRIWRDGPRIREEHHGGRQDGNYGVTDGTLFWSWSEDMGASSNQEDPRLGNVIGQQLEFMLNPNCLLGLLRFRVTGHSEVAGRPTVTAYATARPTDPRRGTFPTELHGLGAGAHHYEFEVDQQRGVLLGVTAIRDGQPFRRITTLAIRFDEPIPTETFQFALPPGEQIRPTRELLPEQITVTEAQERAAFTVLIPDRVPEDWQLQCWFFAASQRPPRPPYVMLSYGSGDGHQSVSIAQMAAADRDSHPFGISINIEVENWQQVTRDGTSVRVRPASWGQAQAYLERDGTFVFLLSDKLSGDQLATIAARLKPAASIGSI